LGNKICRNFRHRHSQGQQKNRNVSDIDEYNIETNDEALNNQAFGKIDQRQAHREIKRMEKRKEELNTATDPSFRNRAKVMLDPTALQKLVGIVLPLQIGSVYGLYQKSLSADLTSILFSFFSDKEISLIQEMRSLLDKYRSVNCDLDLNNIKKAGPNLETALENSLGYLAFLFANKFKLNTKLSEGFGSFFDFEHNAGFLTSLEYVILFRRLLDFVGICSRVLVAIHYRKFFIDSKFNIKYFEGNEKSLGKRGPAGRKTGGGLSGRGFSSAKKNLSKVSGKGALKNIAQKVSMAFAEKIEESLQSESEVEVGGLGASRKLTESQLMSAEDPSNETLELDSRVEDAFAAHSLQPKDPKRPKIPLGNPKAKRGPINIGILQTMSQTKGEPVEKPILKSQDSLS
jgi:hypothetical protein